jgi:hypothetical protein
MVCTKRIVVDISLGRRLDVFFFSAIFLYYIRFCV